jgi:hypothetical protein
MPGSTRNYLLLSRVNSRLASKQLCLNWEFLIRFPVTSDGVELSLLRKNKHNHRRRRSCASTSLEVACHLFC